MPRLPTAVLATGLMLMASLSFACGMILDSVARGRREAKRMAYLAAGASAIALARPGARRRVAPSLERRELEHDLAVRLPAFAVDRWRAPAQFVAASASMRAVRSPVITANATSRPSHSIRRAVADVHDVVHADRASGQKRQPASTVPSRKVDERLGIHRAQIGAPAD